METTSLREEFDLLISNPANFYRTVMEKSDPRVKDWMWMQSPLPTISLIILYIIFVNFGPRFMKNRAPLEMKPLLFVFNAAIVVLYVYLTREYFVGMSEAGYNWICQPVTYSTEPAHMRIAEALWWYYFSKFIEFFDTVFFILRKKNNQVTFLHVYHHSSMFFLWWIGVKWVAGGQSVLGATINSIVHVVMYAYYALSCLGPRVQRFLWWKKHITHLQLLQFSLAIIHAIHSLYIDCNFPKWMHYTLIGYAISFIILFTNFYIHTYIMRGKKRSKVVKGSEVDMANGVSSNGWQHGTDEEKKNI